MADDFELGSAVIPVRVDDKGVDQGLRQVESKVRQAGSRAESGGDGGSLMSKYLFGRRGPDGVGESVEHAMSHAAFGRMSRLVAAGGGIGLGVGLVTHLVFDLGREWLNSAMGAEAHAKAVEKAAEAYKEFREAAEAGIKISQVIARGRILPGAESAHLIAHPQSGLDIPFGRIKQRDEEIAKQKKREEVAATEAAGYDLSDQRKEELRRAAEREVEEKKGATLSRVAEKHALADRKIREEREADRARITRGAILPKTGTDEGGSAAERQARNDGELLKLRMEHGVLGGMHFAGEVAGNFLPGLGSAAGGGLRAIDSFAGGRFSRAAGAAGGIGGQIAEGGRISTEAAQHIADLRKDFARRKAAYDEEQKFSGGGRSSDIANRGAQIQGAILEPSPWEREGRELNRKIRDINADMLKALQELNPLTKLKDVIANMNAGFK